MAGGRDVQSVNYVIDDEGTGVIIDDERVDFMISEDAEETEE